MALTAEERQFGGNDGYPDEPDVAYHWDSNVPRSRDLRVGDAIAIWDKKGLIGVSVIEHIHTERGPKTVYRCAHCGSASIKRRKKGPLFRCHRPSCHAEFDVPAAKTIIVEKFATVHDAAWVEARGSLDAPTVRRLCLSPESQHAMRPLRWPEFRRALEARGASLAHVEGRASGSASSIAGGYRRALTRVRIGQGAFRERLLDQFGPVCAITGGAPPEALEAGHLYSYAELGVHHDHGGLLLRRDIHTLFDRGFITVEPGSAAVVIDRQLMPFTTYERLHGSPIQVSLSQGHLAWIREHRNQHS